MGMRLLTDTNVKEGNIKFRLLRRLFTLHLKICGLVCCVCVWYYGFSISGGNFGTAKLLGHIFPFIPFLQVMVCQLNEMLCKQDGVRPHTANIAIIFVGLIEIIIRINVPQDPDVFKYCFI